MRADEGGAARGSGGRDRSDGRVWNRGRIGRGRRIGVLHRNQDSDDREPRNPSRTPRHHHGEGILPLIIGLGLVGEPGSPEVGGATTLTFSIVTSPTRNPPMRLRPATIRIDQSTLSDESPYLLTVSWHGCADAQPIPSKSKGNAPTTFANPIRRSFNSIA